MELFFAFLNEPLMSAHERLPPPAARSPLLLMSERYRKLAHLLMSDEPLMSFLRILIKY